MTDPTTFTASRATTRTTHRLTNRLGSAAVATVAIEAVDQVCQSLIQRALGSA